MRTLITGASRGIGAATARRLAAPGQEVIVHYFRHSDEAAAVADEVRSRGALAEMVRADLASPEEVLALAAEVGRAGRPLDAMVLNAGRYPRDRFVEADPATFERVFRENLFGPAELVRQLLPNLRAAQPGRIVFVSSILAFQGSRQGAPYAASKAALNGLAHSLARELAPDVLVNSVAPGSIDTAILAEDTPEVRRQREAAIPLGRLGRAEEVADAIAFLISDRASYITGTTVHVNGGLRIG